MYMFKCMNVVERASFNVFPVSRPLSFNLVSLYTFLFSLFSFLFFPSWLGGFSIVFLRRESRIEKR